ncbi:HAMP domain-containing histidine kinase [Blautia sp. RD014234]|nr:HAMP domain-containing histidine kinase [Blautia parvula]
MLAAAVCLGLLLGTVFAAVSSGMQRKTVEQIMSCTIKEEPELAGKVTAILKESSTASVSREGREWLDRYGYTAAYYRRGLLPVYLGISCLCFLGIFAVWLCWYKRSEKGKGQRIEELTAYLEDVNQGRETVLSRREDEFSILEDEIYKTVRELRRTKEEACQERQNLADNLADIAHQLKTPITSMSLMVQLLQQEGEIQGTKVYLDRLEDQIFRMEYLVASLLTLSRLDAGTLELEQENLDAASVIIEACEPLEPRIRAREQTLSIPQQIQACFKGDRHWTAEALSNLIKNCSEHAEEGGSITIKYHQNPSIRRFWWQITARDLMRRISPIFSSGSTGEKRRQGQHRHWPCAVKIPDRAPERNFAGGQRAGRRRLFYRAVLYRFPLERLILQRVDDIFLQ